ncbi:uncharacterized protein LOC117177162 [Belonocnema kinseyi]|uniref:uncharacterized protein LOC117177162 n=1 Tax=Belonocnema kinseyi TaxID=2817044 RepID=UPI00143DB034|nr:uncharacterized protein LOC117177162 [Belonocnema kinseyi]
MTASENDFCPYVKNIGETIGEIECQILSESDGESGQSTVSKILSNAILHAMDALLSAILTPFIVWQWLSEHDHVMMMLKVIFEVTLELMMWTIFAVVSILTTGALLFDDWYKSQEISKIEKDKKIEDPQTDIKGEGQNFQTKSNQVKKIGRYSRDFCGKI